MIPGTHGSVYASNPKAAQLQLSPERVTDTGMHLDASVAGPIVGVSVVLSFNDLAELKAYALSLIEMATAAEVAS